ncbi:Glucooligosaccharide oxidase [Gigaspora rosea]|uniref:Glucooligosaccharide oxidase n=1 Tax=Gigaspora rosea TaxID=44941 RepID=A0A397UML8_9GLOM|nr:Glucooligosaccharide oxidase [Gigaspora rosea]
MSESMFKKVFLRFCLLFLLIIVVKTTPLKKSKKNILESCHIKGQIVYPNNSKYTQDVTSENTRVTFNPAAIVYASNVEDVQNTVKCAKSLNLTITARSGGHSYEEYSIFGDIVLDVTNLNQIDINNNTKTAVIGSGNRLGPIYYKLSQDGFFIPAGSCPSVGISGHALGGGIGLYARKFGTASDNILSIDIVNANGSLITANANQNEDLFYALRGGGSNSYGVVTSFTFKLHPTPPKVTSFKFQYDLSKIQTVFNAINKLGLTITDDMTFSMVMDPSSDTPLELDGVYQGIKKNAQKDLENFISLSKPTSTNFFEESLFSSVVRWSFESVNETMKPTHHPNKFKAKSFLIKPPGLSSKGIQSIKNFTSKTPKDCPTFAIFDLFGGAINRVAADETAFVHRNILYGIQLYMGLNGDSTTNKKCVDQINNFGTNYQKSFNITNSYQNYIDKDLDNWQTRYYGSNYQKLVSVKKKFDPDNFFHFPQSI